MQRRLVGSVVVVAAGLLPALIGGPVFTLLMLGIGIVALMEFLNLGRDAGPSGGHWPLFAVLILVAAGALFAQPVLLLLAAIIGVFIPLALSIGKTHTPGTAERWAWGVAGLGYIALPVFTAIALRRASNGDVSAAAQSLANKLALGWTPAPLGMVWVLAVVLSTWAGDSAAYLTGRSLGRHKLAPVVSPGKSVEGAIGGLLASMLVSAAVFSMLGTFPIWLGAIIGAGIGVSGQVGDLSESFLKRQAGVKDSGDLIPGHGGMLDRVDALLFAFPAALVMYLLIAEGIMR